MPQLKLPGPMGFPWATPPPIPPKEPRKGDPSDPDDPKPSETPTTTSSESHYYRQVYELQHVMFYGYLSANRRLQQNGRDHNDYNYLYSQCHPY
ncbi:hypothetical protein K4K59_008715 [Colletotrichum sp. SAR11_240]|nr:hypothetical protein K4K59_008715 [Colletotrichum sp. SAR11_240]